MLLEDASHDGVRIENHLGDETREHYQVVRVSEAREAIARLREAVFPVIITDLTLPDARGIDAVQRLREEAPDSAIIVVSDKDDHALGRRVIALGAQEFLVKDQLPSTNFARVISYAFERKRAERRLAHLANRDPVTGLANRQHFNSKLVHLMRRARRKARPFGVIYIDLDGFKPINDSYGHDAGDRVLEIVGERVSQTVRDYDVCARLGGDEFAVLAEEPTDRDGVARMCERLVAALGRPMEIIGREMTVSASVGAAMYPDFGESPEELLKAADGAMYQAKQQGGSRVCIRTNKGQGIDADLETRVRAAVENEEFTLNYQPQLDVQTGAVVGVEALLRWQTAPGEFVSPGVFVPVLENTGLIVRVGAWVVHEMCA
ncbi:MAG: GGDEF domain-containing response regulator, partial [Myxococcota bacterium]